MYRQFVVVVVVVVSGDQQSVLPSRLTPNLEALDQLLQLI
jgi:hypothetical protein